MRRYSLRIMGWHEMFNEVIGDVPVALGNTKLTADMRLDGGQSSDMANQRRDQGVTVMFVVVGNRLAGFVSVADPVKETTSEAMHAEGLRIVMVTGDNERTAQAVASRIGIDEIRADVLPED